MSENFVLDLTNVDEEAGGFPVYPKGKYEAIVDDVEYGPSKKGSPMLTWTFKLTQDGTKGKQRFYTVLDQDFGVAALKKTLVALQIEVDWATFDPASFADGGEAIGVPVTLELGIQKYEGEKRNTVKSVLAAADEEF